MYTHTYLCICICRARARERETERKKERNKERKKEKARWGRRSRNWQWVKSFRSCTYNDISRNYVVYYYIIQKSGQLHPELEPSQNFTAWDDWLPDTCDPQMLQKELPPHFQKWKYTNPYKSGCLTLTYGYEDSAVFTRILKNSMGHIIPIYNVHITAPSGPQRGPLGPRHHPGCRWCRSHWDTGPPRSKRTQESDHPKRTKTQWCQRIQTKP